MIEHTDNPLIFNMEINKNKYANLAETKRVCPFCDTPNLKDILDRQGHKIWLKNKFPTVENSLMTVIIESDKHLGDVSTYSVQENREVFRFAFECWQKLLDNPQYKSVLMFKNFGPHSGGTLRHPHMQIVGLEEADGYEHISPENFEGVTLKENSVDITISTRPIMGFVEFNVIISQLEYIDHLADKVQLITQYLLNNYMNGRCDSYNLFFYKMPDSQRYICKIVPRFITSPYYIGYKIPQVNKDNRLEEIAKELKTKLD